MNDSFIPVSKIAFPVSRQVKKRLNEKYFIL